MLEFLVLCGALGRRLRSAIGSVSLFKAPDAALRCVLAALDFTAHFPRGEYCVSVRRVRLRGQGDKASRATLDLEPPRMSHARTSIRTAAWDHRCLRWNRLGRVPLVLSCSLYGMSGSLLPCIVAKDVVGDCNQEPAADACDADELWRPGARRPNGLSDTSPEPFAS